MKKLLWFGDSPAVTTGFGRVSQGVLENLYQTGKYDIYNLGINHPVGDPHRYEGIFKIFAAKARGHVYGFDRVEEVISKVQPDIIIINNDLWIIQHYLSVIPENNRIIVYAPIDALPVHPNWLEVITTVNARACTYTEFARKGILKINPDMIVDVIGHGVDVDEFYPIDDAREFVTNVSSDGFIIQNVNRNQPRKRLDLFLKGCSVFINGLPDEDRKNICVYYHGNMNDVGWDLLGLAKRYGIEDRFLVTNQRDISSAGGGVPLDILTKIYNIADVQIMTSVGEGFGLSPFESAACGIAQVVPNSSATKELWEGVCPLIDIDHHDVLTGGINTEGAVISIDSMVSILKDLYYNRDKLKAYAEACYKHSQKERFTWDYVATRFDELIEDVLSGNRWLSRKYNKEEEVKDESTISEHEGDEGRD